MPTISYSVALAFLGLLAVESFTVSQPSRSHGRDQPHFASTMESPSLAQTHMTGPWKPNGSGKSLTKAELDWVKAELEKIKTEHGLKEPERAFLDEPDTKWRFGGPPDYSLVNYLFLTERTKMHPEGSLESVVENLVKTWEMERSHKVDPTQHKSVDQEKFRISANGGKVFNNVEANDVGNYNVLLSACPAELYDAASHTWEQSHAKFEESFSAFPWEVLDVYSGPPKVAFSWRHWGHFTGEYEGNKGNGELVEMYGFATAEVNDKLQLTNVEVYYDAAEFISVKKGHKSASEANRAFNSGCPAFASFTGQTKKNGFRARLGARIAKFLIRIPV